MHLDVELALWRNLVEATAASVALYIDDAKAVTCALADALERGEQTWFDLRFEFLCLHLQMVFLGACLLDDVVEFVTLHFEFLYVVVEVQLCLLAFGNLVLNLLLCLAYLLVAELYLELLEFNLLAESVVLAVVSHIVELQLVSLHACLSLDDVALAVVDSFLKLINLVVDLVDANFQTFDFVFEVLHFKGQFASQGFFLVDGRQ